MKFNNPLKVSCLTTIQLLVLLTSQTIHAMDATDSKMQDTISLPSHMDCKMHQYLKGDNSGDKDTNCSGSGQYHHDASCRMAHMNSSEDTTGEYTYNNNFNIMYYESPHNSRDFHSYIDQGRGAVVMYDSAVHNHLGHDWLGFTNKVHSRSDNYYSYLRNDCRYDAGVQPPPQP